MTTKQQIADRAAELIGESHLLPESYAVLEAKHVEAMSALDRMTDQRDQLAAQFKDATAQLARAGDLLNDVRDYLGGFESGGFMLLAVVNAVDEYLAGKLPEQHPDDAAVDRFSTAMKEKLAAAREKGRGGWDDPEACSVEFLADLLVGHVDKGNPGNFEDIANLAMMLHQRGADPAVLAHAATLTACTRCEGHGMVGGVTGQTPENMDFWDAPCLDCSGRGKVTAPKPEGQ